MRDFKMPALGADMEAGMLAEWLVKPGDHVKSGDIVCVVETQKGAIDVEIFEDGTVAEIVVHAGEEVPVGATLARLDGAGDEEGAVPQPSAEPAKAPPPAPPSPPKAVEPPPRVKRAKPTPPPPAEPAVPAAAVARLPVSPAARRRAAELGIDPAGLRGTGVDGSVTLADVELAAREPRARPAPKPVAPAETPTRPARRGFDPAEMRQAIAAAMQRSKREIPHYYLAQTVDMAAAMAWLEETNRDRPPPERLLPAALLLKATALAMAEVPQLNGSFADGAFRPGDGIHVGWIVALRGGGLMAPAIRDADKLALSDVMTRLRDLVQRARAGGIRASELGSATVTVTSLGERGADSVIGVIYPPQVAILGFGRIARRPWVVGDEVAVRPLVEVTLAADHRVCDGHLGGLLLAAIDRHLQQPEVL